MPLTVVVVYALAVVAATRLAAQSRTAAGPADSVDSTTVLGPGDLIRLRIWREPDLSGDFQVDERGMVVLPKIGPISIHNHSGQELNSILVQKYSAYLRDPAIEITILHRVNVLGAVQKPGLYPVDRTMTVADVFALAGGVAPDGNPDGGSLMRGGKRVNIKLSQRTTVGEMSLQSGDQLYVPQRSWLSRNPGVIAGAITALASIILVVRR
jgi:polysaccharide export outer membrane protein